MKFSVIAGKNKKLFVRIDEIQTKSDLELHKNVIKKVLYRKEFKPFIQSFNKNIEQSYLFNEVYFPITFWEDVKRAITEYTGTEPILHNENLCFNEEINQAKFDEFISSLKLPEKYDVNSDKYSYQRDSAYKALQNKIGRIEIGTSGGKTFITYLYCRYILENINNWNQVENQKILIIVPSKLLATQLKEDFKEYSSLEEKQILVESIFSGSKRLENAHVVCGTFQSLSNYEVDYFDEFRFIICDELHRAKSYSIKTEIYDKLRNADFFFGMTGTTPQYKTLDYLHITAMFGPCLVLKQVKDLISDGVSVKVDLNIIKIKYNEHKNFSNDLKLSNIVGTDKYRVEKEFFQTNEKRNLLIVKLLKHFTSNALILVDTIDYCYGLETFLNEHLPDRTIRVINGEVKNRQEIIDEMKSSTNGFILIGTYGTMSTGVSISNIEQLYFVDGGKSEIRIRQSIGRGIRLNPGKVDCKVFDFYDDMQNSSFKNHAMERIKYYKQQNFPFKISEIEI